MDFFQSIQQVGTVVEQMTPKIEAGMTDLSRIADALTQIAISLDKINNLMADYINYAVQMAVINTPDEPEGE